MMRHAANAAAAAWAAPGEVWEYVSQLVNSYHDQHDCQKVYTAQPNLVSPAQSLIPSLSPVHVSIYVQTIRHKQLPED